MTTADPFIAVITAHIARDANNQPLNYYGREGNRAQHAKSFERYKGHVAQILANFPRMDDETPHEWHVRVVSKSPRHEDSHVLMMAGRLHAILDRMDREAEEEARRQEAASAARREAERAEHRRAAMPDVAELAQLRRTIDSAAEGERLLEQVFAAFTAHKSAQAARSRINTIFDSARQARQSLRVDGEVISNHSRSSRQFAMRLRALLLSPRSLKR